MTTETKISPRAEPFVALAPALFILLWGTGFVGTKLGIPYAEPFTFLAIRFAIAGGILTLIAFIAGAPWPREARMVGHIAIAGILLNAAYLAGVFGAISFGVSAGVVALVAGIQPLLTAAVAGPILGERVGFRHWCGLVLGFLGIILVVWEKLAFGDDPLGYAFAILCLVGITAGTIYQKRYAAGQDLRSGTAIQLLASLPVVLGFALVFETMHVEWTPEFALALAWLVLVLSIGAFNLFLYLIRRGKASRVSALFFLTPPTAAVMGYFMFGETLGALALAGMVCAVAGVALASR